MIKQILSLTAATILAALFCTGTSAQEITPDGTYMFVQRDTCDLYLDLYKPAKGSETTFNGKDFRFIVEERDAYQVYSEDDSGVGLNAEIYARNMRVEERFDINISYFDSEIQAQDRMVVYCQADEHIAEVCAYPMTMGNTPLVYNCWTNWKNIPYLNFDQPWWNKESIDDFTIN